MSGVNRVLDFTVCRISTAEGAVKLFKCNIPALGMGSNSLVTVTVKAVQLVVSVVVIEGAGDVLCARLLGECVACNVHNGFGFAAFGIADRVFLAPVAVTVDSAALRSVCRWVAIIGKEAGIFQVRGDFRGCVHHGLIVCHRAACVFRCGELHCGERATIRNHARPQLTVGAIGCCYLCHRPLNDLTVFTRQEAVHCTAFARHGILVYIIVPGISVRGQCCIKINGFAICKQITACVCPRVSSSSAFAIDKAVVRYQINLRGTIAIIFAEIVPCAFTACPSKLYKLRLVVRNCDFLGGHGISRYRANRLTASFYKSTVFIFFVKCSDNTVQRCCACIFEVKRHTRVIVFPLAFIVRVVFNFGASVIKLRGCGIKHFSGKLINRCPVLIAFTFSAKGEELTFPSITVQILENQSIKSTIWVVPLT